MPEQNLKISFLVPTLGERETELNRLFNSLVEQENKAFEVIVVAQDNYEKTRTIFKKYNKQIEILFIESYERGLSKARNKGLKVCRGNIVVLSDDDCWYPPNAVETIIKEFQKDSINVLLTQIYDLKRSELYKNYSEAEKVINSELFLLSRSSIEIAFENNFTNLIFDEMFGLGAQFVCGEEVDFLIRMYRNAAKIKYVPKISVYHEKKAIKSSVQQLEAKGAIYAKNFNFLVGILVCFRDILLKKENNFRFFLRGYNEYKKNKRNN